MTPVVLYCVSVWRRGWAGEAGGDGGDALCRRRLQVQLRVAGQLPGRSLLGQSHTLHQCSKFKKLYSEFILNWIQFYLNLFHICHGFLFIEFQGQVRVLLTNYYNSSKKANTISGKKNLQPIKNEKWYFLTGALLKKNVTSCMIVFSDS